MKQNNDDNKLSGLIKISQLLPKMSTVGTGIILKVFAHNNCV